jgi:SSS family solute:Na+ symporter
MFSSHLDLTFFAIYLPLNICLGPWVARWRTGGTRDYFLAGDQLPWYAIGASISVLIWIFLPFYMRGGVYIMPEFLERRYNRACRYLFAICSLVLWIIAQMAVVMLAGAKALDRMFGVNPILTILGLAILAGSYTIYGGLISVAWTDFVQFYGADDRRHDCGRRRSPAIRRILPPPLRGAG